jgi:hypothetical protein
MKFSVIISLIVICISCRENSSTHAKNINKFNNRHEVKFYNYTENTIPSFFNAMIDQHLQELKIIDSSIFREVCILNNLDLENVQNVKCFYTISFLHKFFTCQNAINGSRGKIINIPYYWHWVTPNPRDEIMLNKLNRKLNEVISPQEFSKYKSFADIDRTPYLFLSELFLDSPKYFSSLSDTFSTFGWCSEREMAFVSLLDILGYNGKVIAENNHSWSEFIIPMIDKKKKSHIFKVKVDNTFDHMDWDKVSPGDIIRWNGYQGKSKLANWYNLQAHSEKEKEQISKFPISKLAIKRIENSLVEYLTHTINVR